MKLKILLQLFCSCALVLLFFSCDDKDNENLENTMEEYVEINVQPNGDNVVAIWMKVKSIIVDWGDGCEDELEFDRNFLVKLNHEYTDNKLRNVIIKARGLESIGGFESYVLEGHFQKLRINNCSFLKEVNFSNQELTTFEIEGCELLVNIDCSHNKLSTSALNNLFNKLPVVEKGYINYCYNDGAQKCDNSILREKGWIYEDQPNTDISFEDEEHLKTAYLKILNETADFIRSHYLFEALYSNTVDENKLVSFGNLKNIYAHNLSSMNSSVYDLWVLSYQIINSCNYFIQKMDMTSPKKEWDGYRYSVSLIRNSIYYILLNYWGDIPFLNETNYYEEENFAIPRKSQSEILSFLIKDLIVAENNLPEMENPESGIFSYYYAQILLSRIYTYQGNHSKALEYCMKIINSNNFSLVPDLSEVYEKHNKELITNLVPKYDEDASTWVQLIKKGNYMPYARYAEVLLLTAENYLDENKEETISLINLLRTRNGRPLLEVSATIDHVVESILEEYKLDLGKEGLYFFTLKRFDRAEKVLNIASYQKLLPIPSYEMMANPLIVQNPGY